ncbi:predicted protein [Verticillium alfalfae VaMs.102]|uniref:Predicted protein n=1 Tax=Verticillium alfalfae (strain VaMs.102 / ATCC MYA-4576 / FGSC 10136) TaxID=526221 RepID=C9SVZ3_VERA1|nr:predicted protein [Verticillium alfalfae VaMs.102]EEY22958.1 predicted protein [Verticillium alfalfae VaMs.102]
MVACRTCKDCDHCSQQQWELGRESCWKQRYFRQRFASRQRPVDGDQPGCGRGFVNEATIAKSAVTTFRTIAIVMEQGAMGMCSDELRDGSALEAKAGAADHDDGTRAFWTCGRRTWI